jgi:hypothetical protein
MDEGEILLTFSMTEIPHFERLVEFLNDAEDHARDVDDYTLLALVDQARDELAELSR